MTYLYFRLNSGFATQRSYTTLHNRPPFIAFLQTNGGLTHLASSASPPISYRGEYKTRLWVSRYACQTDSSMYVLHSCRSGSRSLIILTRSYLAAAMGYVKKMNPLMHMHRWGRCRSVHVLVEQRVRYQLSMRNET